MITAQTLDQLNLDWQSIDYRAMTWADFDAWDGDLGNGNEPTGSFPVARLYDKVIMNCPHGATGTIITASANVFVNGLAIAREGDTVRCDKCGVTRTIDHSTTSLVSFANDLRMARAGDTSTGVCDLKTPDCPHITVANISTGSSNTFVG